MASTGQSLESLGATLRTAAATLRDAGIRYALAGSLAAWARGGPAPQSDLDLMVAPDDAQAALKALEQAGMRPEHTPEEWLFKAWDGEVMIDLIFRPSGLDLDDEAFARADTISVLAVAMPVMAIEDVLVTKLFALDEHALDYAPLVAIARALREQIDWATLRARTEQSAYARAFFVLMADLGVAPAQDHVLSAAPRRDRGELQTPERERVRVINPST